MNGEKMLNRPVWRAGVGTGMRAAMGLVICALFSSTLWATPKAAESEDAPVTRTSEAAKPVFARPNSSVKAKAAPAAKSTAKTPSRAKTLKKPKAR